MKDAGIPFLGTPITLAQSLRVGAICAAAEVEIVYDVDQLRTYAVWNAVAVVKILKKRRPARSDGH